MSGKDNETRALPGAVFVPENTIHSIVKRVAKLPADRRDKEKIVLIRSGRYRANTDQIVLYNHWSKGSSPKADLLEVSICKVGEISPEVRFLMSAPEEEDKFLCFMRKYWDESLEPDSPVTVLTCCNLTGGLVEKAVRENLFHNTLPQHGQE